MRPLPDLSPVSPSSSVFTLPADDWLSVVSDNGGGLESFLSELEGEENTQSSNAAAIGDAIDSMGSGLNDLIGAFNTLSDVMDAFDVAGDVQAVSLAFLELADNLTNWDGGIPNQLVSDWLSHNLFPAVTSMIQIGVQPVYTNIAQVEQSQGGGLLGDILNALAVFVATLIKPSGGL